MSTNLPIPSLDPSASPPANSTIKGVVTLLWPYSSSTLQCAFLLSDPDFRLRSKRGQVRVRFNGASAKAIAERRLGIGDVVELQLEGARWEEQDEDVRARTPGRGVEGELVFGRKVGLGLKRDGEGDVERIVVDAPLSPRREKTGLIGVGGGGEAVTPAPVRPPAPDDLLRRSLDASSVNGNAGWTYASPAFAKRVRLFSEESLLDSAYDPFLDDIGEVESSERRTSFGPGLRWRLKSRTPSPVKESFVDLEEASDDDVEMLSPSKARAEGARADELVRKHILTERSYGDVEIGRLDRGVDYETNVTSDTVQRPDAAAGPASSPAMPSSALARLNLPAAEPSTTLSPSDNAPDASTEGPSTPELLPVKSPTLPLPSPFPTDRPPTRPAASNPAPRSYAANSLFGPLGSAASVIERRRVSGQSPYQASLQPRSLPSHPPSFPKPPVPAPRAEAGAERTPDRESAPRPAASIAAETIDLTDEQDENEEAHDDEVRPQELSLNESFSTTIPDDEMYDDYGLAVRDGAPADVGTGRPGAKEIIDVVSDAENSIRDVQLTNDSPVNVRGEDDGDVEVEETLADNTTSNPETEIPGEESNEPVKTRPDEFGLDGTAFSLVAAHSPPERGPSPASPQIEYSVPDPSAVPLSGPMPSGGQDSAVPPLATPARKQPQDALADPGTSSRLQSAHGTPQSEKDRLRKSTYRSLFGLKSPTKRPSTESLPQVEKTEERFVPGWFYEIEGEQQQVEEVADARRQHVRDHSVEALDSGGQLKDVTTNEDVIMLDQRAQMEENAHQSRELSVNVRAAPPSEAPIAELDVRSDVHQRADRAIAYEQKADGIDRETAEFLHPSPKDDSLSTSGVATDEHIAPPRRVPQATVVDLSEPDDLPSIPVGRSYRTLQVAEQSESSGPNPLYPTLPLSPSNSQSLQDLQSQSNAQEPIRSKLPPTPQLTQRESSTRTEDPSSLKTPATKLSNEASFLRAEAESTGTPATPQAKTPSRRSTRLRASNVPHVLSEWFSPRTSDVGRQQNEAEAAEGEVAVAEEANSAGAVVTNGNADRSDVDIVTAPPAGLVTAYSYFTPLSKLSSFMNPSSQSAGALDILAIVTDKTKEPGRARSGPKDFFTIFRVVDASIGSVHDSVRAEIFRPYKNTLPTAKVGDVVLLRAFVVRSKKRTPYLLSTDASAWCVWRFPDAREAEKPTWARKGKGIPGVEEEINGPPVEFGDEERAHAQSLRQWWIDERQADVNDSESSKGKVAKEIVAKL